MLKRFALDCELIDLVFKLLLFGLNFCLFELIIFGFILRSLE